MKHTRSIFLILLLFFSSCAEPKENIDDLKLEGLWSLQIMEVRDSITNTWSEWRDGMQGFLLYDDKGNMALHLTLKDYEKTDLSFPNFDDSISIDALKHLTGSYAYFGKYEINDKKDYVQHSRISHSNPGEWNKIVKRYYSFNGDTLIISPMEKENASLRLKWTRY